MATAIHCDLFSFARFTHFVIILQVWCQREVWMWARVRCSGSTDWWQSRTSLSLYLWLYPAGWECIYSLKTQSRDTREYEKGTLLLASHCTVHVFPVRVVPRRYLSNDAWQQACFDLTGVARWHQQRSVVGVMCIFCSFVIWLQQWRVIPVVIFHCLCLLGPVLVSLKPGSQVAESYSEMNKGLGNPLDTRRSQSRPGMLQLAYIQDQLGTKDSNEDTSRTEEDRSRTAISNGEDLALCSPPRTENEVLNGVYIFLLVNEAIISDL